MILFVSDLHFEPNSAEADEAERDLVELLNRYERELSRVVLLGDVFDAFIEYGTLVPRPPVRLFGWLAQAVDTGMPVDYVLGNHDPWHHSWVSEALGFGLHTRSLRLQTDAGTVHVEHGDQPLGRPLARAIVRHPIARVLYSSLLPGDTGQRLAAWVSRTMRRRPVDPGTSQRLEAWAGDLLRRERLAGVVLGHTHLPASRTFDHGTYVNAGSWRTGRTFATADASGLRLRQWGKGG